MLVGKLTPQALNDRIFKHLNIRRPEVLVHSSLGEDSSVIDFADELCVVSTDPITGAVHKAGWLAVHVSANDVASNGAQPITCLLTIMAPPTVTEQEIEQIMVDAAEAAGELQVEIIGGHTEVTTSVNQIVLSATVMGKAKREQVLKSSGARDGDQIVVTKGVGWEGSAIIAHDGAAYLEGKVAQELLDEARAMANQISVVKEALLARDHGATAMHDVTEGGVLGALYEMAVCSELGFTIDRAQLPLMRSTKAICQALDVDPLRLISSGSLLIAVQDGGALVQVLTAAGVPAAVIGHFHQGQRLLREGEQLAEVIPPASDELWRALAKIQSQA